VCPEVSQRAERKVEPSSVHKSQHVMAPRLKGQQQAACQARCNRLQSYSESRDVQGHDRLEGGGAHHAAPGNNTQSFLPPFPPSMANAGTGRSVLPPCSLCNQPHPQGLCDRLNQFHHSRPRATATRQAPPTRVGQGGQCAACLHQLLGGGSQQGGARRLQRSLFVGHIGGTA
jgi:hypothetical protein